jgi:hypothetical protein
MDINPYAPPTAIVVDAAPTFSGSISPFFPVSTTKLIVLSLCTLGLYEVYWFYKNWQQIKARDQSDIWPAARAIFAIFYCSSCFKHIRDFETPGLGKTSLAAGELAAGWIIITLLGRLPDPFWLISLGAPFFLLPVQSQVNRINAAINPEHDPNSRFSVANWIAVVLGAILLVLAVIGAMMN